MSIEKHLLLGYKPDLPEDIAKTIADYLMEREERKEESAEDKLMEILHEERQDRRSAIMHWVESAMMRAHDFTTDEPEEVMFAYLKREGYTKYIIGALMRNPFTFKQYVALYKNNNEMINNFIKYMIHCRYYHTHPVIHPA